jgi:hypothetical protein
MLFFNVFIFQPEFMDIKWGKCYTTIEKSYMIITFYSQVHLNINNREI